MAVVGLVAPRLPSTPPEYSAIFMADLIKALEIFIQQERTAGDQRGTTLVLTNMPASDTGLEAGTLYRIGNNVKISLLDMAVPDPATATAELGSVSVTTS